MSHPSYPNNSTLRLNNARASVSVNVSNPNSSNTSLAA